MARRWLLLIGLVLGFGFLNACISPGGGGGGGGNHEANNNENDGGDSGDGGTTATIPAAPSTLIAASAGTSQIDLTWTDNSTDETGFILERKIGAGGTYAQIATPAADATGYSDFGLAASTTYYYRVRASNSAGSSGNSNEANATTQGVTVTAPDAPSLLNAAASGSVQINLTWTDNATTETGFILERKTGAGGTYAQIATPAANATSYANTGLAASTTYYYRVRATNSAGPSDYSNEAVATTAAPPPPPSAPSGLNAAAAGSSQINLTWTDNATTETGFKLERKTGSGGTYAQIATPGANATSYADSGLTASTTYYYRIRATNAAGDSGYSNEANATTSAAPAGDSYVVLAYNDTGMNVMNQDFATLMFAPPNNTLRAQVIKRGNPPAIVTTGVTLSYSIPGNTHSSDKTNFWTNSLKLIGRTVAADTGITGNKLTGAMVYATNGYWNATGIPLTPKMDNGAMNPYPLATITVKTNANATVVATTQTPAAVSWEIGCTSCHSLPAILALHGLDGKGGTKVLQMQGDCKICHPNGTGSWLRALPTPIFCGRCHPQAQLQSLATGNAAYPPLSRAVHGSHAGRTSDCTSCHPGQTDKYLRDVHFDMGLTCADCHGSMTTLAGATRKPWVDEPKCTNCHGAAGHTYEQANTLYKDSLGHHGVTCAACHGAPHAIGPSTVAADNTQAIALQGAAGPISTCTVCHLTTPATAFNHTY